ncbi:HHL016Wp [Eremothecium sinecaudum]|uniref:HHL016Wp n=1 Tax=Eremothecium sinecaudum TaxID=45286 RepID=A0A0X8HWE0_9SACH|nr:HHL016Wp [Eremothecium sinecaudum]AMD22754.1 HHL016Wp [Eremothecium sinecaudum]
MGIQSLDYDPTNDVISILSEFDSLEQLNRLIAVTRNRKLELEHEIKDELASNDSTNDGLDDSKDLEELIDYIGKTKIMSKETESTISHLTKGISYLDNAKRNLTHSMSWFQNLKSLTDAYASCEEYFRQYMFKEMYASYSLMTSLSSVFEEYKSVDEINILLNKVHTLEHEILNRIKILYRKLFENRGNVGIDESTFEEGICKLLEITASTKFEIIDWCLDKVLEELQEIFSVDDEAGSLENISRRYLFFKKVLNNFQTNYSSYFPSDWAMPSRLTSMFLILTKHDLEILLHREMAKSSSLELFMNALQSTIEFEKYINVKFPNMLNKGSEEKLSTCFEPYLSLWISHNDKIMNSKILTYLSEPKLPDSTESHVIPSSADLFRTYRAILSQTLELIEGNGRNTVLVDLAGFFSRWLVEYSNKILQPLLLPENARIEDRDEVVQYTILMINTADYCSTTVGQLEEKLQAYSDRSELISQYTDNARSDFSVLISRGIRFLLNQIIAPPLKFAWREFANYDWSNSMVEDYSRYVLTIKHILLADERQGKSLIQNILSQFERDIYKWNILGHIVDLIINEYLRVIVNLLRPRQPYGTLTSKRHFSINQVINIGEQLLLDVQFLKEVLKQLPDSLSHDRPDSSTRYNNRIDTSIDQMIDLFNILVSPIEPIAKYHENFFKYAKTKSHICWALLLSLKGMSWDLAQWKSFWSEFNAQEGALSDIDINLFVFQRDENIIRSFISDLEDIVDPTWRAFFTNDLLIPLSNKKQTHFAQTPNSVHINKSINENLKHFVSSTRFFSRGG